MTSLAERVAAAVNQLPMLPAALVKLYPLLASERSSAADISEVIRSDPSLTANLLRAANSVVTRGVSEIATVRDAVTRVGLHRVRDLLAGLELKRLVPPTIPGYQLDARGFWGHCVATGVLADRLSRATGIPSDLAFTAGLLHDVGKLVVGLFLGENAPALAAQLDLSTLMIDAERAVLLTDHAEVGEAVGQRWGLPERLTLVARWHHEPSGAPPELRALCEVVQLADGLAHSIGYGADVGGLQRTLTPFEGRDLPLERILGDACPEIIALTQP